MFNFNKSFLIDKRGGVTEEKQSHLEKTAKDIFLKSFNLHIGDLAEEGIIPEWFADKRKEAAALVEADLSNPQKHGKEFAWMGVEAILEFKKQIDALTHKTFEKIMSRIYLAKELMGSQNEASLSSEQKEALKNFKDLVSKWEARANALSEGIDELYKLNLKLQLDANHEAIEEKISAFKAIFNESENGPSSPKDN